MTFYLHPYSFGFRFDKLSAAAQDGPYRRLARRWAENNEHSLGVNVREEEEAYILSSLVPGLNADDLHIQVLDDVLRIEGEYKRSMPQSGSVDEADEDSYLLNELPHGSFTRTLRLPAAIEADHVEAQITDGVLTLRLPKAESARPKQIKITSK